MDILIDFSDSKIKPSQKNNTTLKNRYKKEYDDATTKYYTGIRKAKIDPIDNSDLKENNSFKVENMWDPYTGNFRCEKDPIGPIYFNPLVLAYNFYLNRLRGLWEDSEDGYQSYYGEFMGSGDDMEITCRGKFKERYVFRIPIIDCYLPKDYDRNIITMGPKLTDDDMVKIDKLIEDHWKDNKSYLNEMKKVPSFYLMKKYYDIAISNHPSKLNLENIPGINLRTAMKQNSPDNYLNIKAVEILKAM